MRNCPCNFIYRLFLMFLFGILVSGCAIAPEAPTFTPIAFTPIAASTQTQTPSRPFWELDSTRDPNRGTAVSALLQTTAPLVTPTPLPGQELIAYLPRPADLPECQAINYVVALTSAQAACSLIPRGSLSISIISSPAPYAAKSLALPAAYQPVQFETLGQASIAGVNEQGDAMTVAFITRQVRVSLTYNTPKQEVNPTTVLLIARKIEEKVPASSPPPLALSFPENRQLEKKATYFSTINFSLITDGQYRYSSDFKQGDRVCVYAAPVRRAYDQLWTIVLYDLQKEQVLKKMVRGMYAQSVCGGLEPDYTKDSYKAGDRYEIRIAVNYEWIATLPFETSNPSQSSPPRTH